MTSNPLKRKTTAQMQNKMMLARLKSITTAIDECDQAIRDIDKMQYSTVIRQSMSCALLQTKTNLLEQLKQMDLQQIDTQA